MVRLVGDEPSQAADDILVARLFVVGAPAKTAESALGAAPVGVVARRWSTVGPWLGTRTGL